MLLRARASCAGHPDRAIDDERLGVALDRLLEPADVPQRGAALVQDRGACHQHRCRRPIVRARARRARRAIDELERLLDQAQRLLGIADEPRDRGTQAQRLGLEQHVLGLARVLQRGCGGAQRGGSLADIDVELGERAVRLGELAGLADGLGFLAERVELAELLRALGEPAQDLLAQPVGGEPALVIGGRQELERARQLAEPVGVAAEIERVAGGAQVAIGGGHVVAGELEVARDQRVVLAEPVARSARNPGRDRAVHLDPRLGGDQAVGDGHRHVVLEPVLAVDRLGVADHRRQQAAPHQLVELEPDRPAEQLGERCRRDVAAEHRGVHERVLLGGGQRVDAHEEQILDGRGHLDRRLALDPAQQAGCLAGLAVGDQDAALGQRVDQLLDEERVAAAARRDLLDELVDVVPRHEALGQHLLARSVGQLVEQHDLGAELARELHDARLGAARHDPEDRAWRVDLEQRGEQLLAVLVGPVHVLADEHDRLLALEPLLDPVEQLDQRLPPRVGIDLGRWRRAARAEQHAEDLQRGARFARGLLAGKDQRCGAQQAALDLVRLGILGEPEHVAREIRDHAVRSHRRADAPRRPDDHGLLRVDALEERPHDGALADAGIADDHDLALALGDQHVAPRIAQRLELELAPVESPAGIDRAMLAQPLRALLGPAQPVDMTNSSRRLRTTFASQRIEGSAWSFRTSRSGHT